MITLIVNKVPQLYIYIVEDDMLMAATLKRMLIALGHSICGIADSYKKAVHDLHNIKTDLIISDIMINGNETGIDLGRYASKHLNIPFIYYSSIIEKKTIKEAWNTIPGGYLTKPATLSSLEDTINNVINNKVYCTNLASAKNIHFKHTPNYDILD